MTKHLTKPIRAIHLMVLAFLMKLSSPVAAQDLQKGHVAYEAGDYATAIKEWMPLAEAGDALAQNSLGFMYQIGRGVPQDYKQSVKWYRLSANQSGTFILVSKKCGI
jgi:TPR repeat protein